MKKLLCTVLALILVLTLVSGCSNQAAQVGTSSPEPASTADASNGKIGAPDAPVTVKYICMDVNPEDDSIPEMVTEIEKKMAEQGNYVKLEVLDQPGSDHYSVALPLAFKTGQINPDIVYFQGGDEACSAEGLLEDLTPYIEGSTYVKSLLEGHSSARVANYPYLLWLAPPKTNVPVIRTDLLNKLDSAKALLENPTPENYKALMQEAKDKGITKYGITNDGKLLRMDSIFNHAFGITTTLVQKDGKWVYTKATEAEKNKIAYYAELYAAGLLDPEYITKKWDTMEKAFYEGDALLIAGGAGDVINIYDNKQMQTNGEGAALTVLPPAKGISQDYLSVDVTKETRGFGISTSSKVNGSK